VQEQAVGTCSDLQCREIETRSREEEGDEAAERSLEGITTRKGVAESVVVVLSLDQLTWMGMEQLNQAK
jgi:hypothetical protein